MGAAVALTGGMEPTKLLLCRKIVVTVEVLKSDGGICPVRLFCMRLST